MPARNVLRCCLPLLLLLVVAGCGMAGSRPAAPAAVLNRLGVVVERGANQDTATALDLVFAYDQQAAAVLPHTGPEWFARKADYQSGLGPTVEVVSLQLPPSTKIDEVALPPRYRQAVAVYVYANYLAPAGQARLSVGAYPSAVVRLTPDHVVIERH